MSEGNLLQISRRYKFVVLKPVQLAEPQDPSSAAPTLRDRGESQQMPHLWDRTPSTLYVNDAGDIVELSAERFDGLEGERYFDRGEWGMGR